MASEIRVELSKVIAKAPLRALADVVIRCDEGDITIHRCAVFEKDGQPPWANLPHIPVQRDGKTRYAPLIDLPRALKKQITDAMLAEYSRVAHAHR
jgi:hypothetical protein